MWPRKKRSNPHTQRSKMAISEGIHTIIWPKVTETEYRCTRRPRRNKLRKGHFPKNQDYIVFSVGMCDRCIYIVFSVGCDRYLYIVFSVDLIDEMFPKRGIKSAVQSKASLESLPASTTLCSLWMWSMSLYCVSVSVSTLCSVDVIDVYTLSSMWSMRRFSKRSMKSEAQWHRPMI